ncbi:hypothetical protein AN220_17575 [Streptomyces nanshensis]|nr:hypothetical protein AN220_17575 [Streptomyces nanshensis]
MVNSACGSSVLVFHRRATVLVEALVRVRRPLPEPAAEGPAALAVLSPVCTASLAMSPSSKPDSEVLRSVRVSTAQRWCSISVAGQRRSKV